MALPVVAVVLVESTWVRQIGMSALFESKAPSGDVRIIFVTSYTGIYPVVDSAWLKRNLSGKVLQPGHAARRIRHRQHQTPRRVNRGMSQYPVR
jgi:hypothetical protein